MKKLFSEENQLPGHWSYRWQGPPPVNRVKQYEPVFSFKVSLLIEFIEISAMKFSLSFSNGSIKLI